MNVMRGTSVRCTFRFDRTEYVLVHHEEQLILHFTAKWFGQCAVMIIIDTPQKGFVIVN